MRSALIVAVLFLVASANGMTFHKLKHSALQARATSAVTTYDGFVIKAVSGTLPGCDDIGATKCQQLKDAATLATTTINTMLTHLATHKSDTKFTTAFGTASGADVKACLDKMAQSTSELKLWNALSNKDGTVYQSGAPNAWAGFAVITGTTKLLVGASSYSWSSKEMAEALIHEASHAFCGTVDLHNGKIGYKDSGFFDTCKGATNADSYRVYAQLM